MIKKLIYNNLFCNNNIILILTRIQLISIFYLPNPMLTKKKKISNFLISNIISHRVNFIKKNTKLLIYIIALNKKHNLRRIYVKISENKTSLTISRQLICRDRQIKIPSGAPEGSFNDRGIVDRDRHPARFTKKRVYLESAHVIARVVSPRSRSAL